MEEKEEKKKEEKKKKELSVGQWLLIFLFCVIIMVFLGVNSSNSKNNEVTSVVITEDGIKKVRANDFEIIYDETSGTRKEDGTFEISGKLKQNVEGSYTGLFVTVTLLDKSGNKVRDTDGWQYSNYLGNNIWEFRVSGNDADGIVTAYRLKSAYGY